MVYAVLCMRRGVADGRRSYKFNSKLYEKMRLRFVDLMRKFMADHCPTRGKTWIYNLDLLQSKPWPKELPIPDGWKIGRHYVGTMKKMVKIRDKLQKLEEFDNNPTLISRICQDETAVDRKISFEENNRKRDELLKQMYHDYLNLGFDRLKKKYNYTKSRENLITAFKRHVPEYDKKALLSVSTTIKRETGGYKQSKKNMKMPKEEKIKYFTEMYHFFREFGFQKTVEKYEWQSSRNAMVQNFKNYVSEYVPTKTHRWG